MSYSKSRCYLDFLNRSHMVEGFVIHGQKVKMFDARRSKKILNPTKSHFDAINLSGFYLSQKFDHFIKMGISHHLLRDHDAKSWSTLQPPIPRSTLWSLTRPNFWCLIDAITSNNGCSMHFQCIFDPYLIYIQYVYNVHSMHIALIILMYLLTHPLTLIPPI